MELKEPKGISPFFLGKSVLILNGIERQKREGVIPQNLVRS